MNFNCRVGRVHKLIAEEVDHPINSWCAGCFYADSNRKCPKNSDDLLVCMEDGHATRVLVLYELP